MTTANATTSVSANIATVEFAEVKRDPVAWAKKGNKIIYGNVGILKPDAMLNIRHRLGTVVHGVLVETDTYDLPSMEMAIVNLVGIMEPILVSVRANGDHVPLRGNRRTYAGQGLLANPGISAELRKALTERTPMILLHGLTLAQERELIQDQTQKEFLHSEVVKHIFALVKDHQTFEQIAMSMWETLGKFTGGKKQAAEARAIIDPVAKAAKIQSWLRGSLKDRLIWGYACGPFVRKAIMLKEMENDNLIPPNGEKAYFDPTTKRIGKLKTAKANDGSKWNGEVRVEGSEFWKLIEEFHAEDNSDKKKEKSTEPKMMLRKDLVGIQESFASRCAKAMIDRVLGNPCPDLQMRDEFAGMMETKLLLVEEFMPKLTPETGKLLRLVFMSPDSNEFQKFLEANCSAIEATEESFRLPGATDSEGTAVDEVQPPMA